MSYCLGDWVGNLFGFLGGRSFFGLLGCQWGG